MQQSNGQINTNIKKCNKCNKFYDESNNNFFMNLAISKFKKNNGFTDNLLEKIQKNINETSQIDWCTCYSVDKKKSTEAASANFDTMFIANSSKFNIQTIGLDFTINKDILYIENNKFSTSDFLRYCKSIKQKLNNSIFDFDFITHDKISDEKFLRNYKNYFVNPNFLLITDLHQIKENQIMELKNILTIVRERLSNNLRTFIVLNQDLELFKKTLKANNWAKNELIYNELIEILSDKFDKKLITISSSKNEIKINTLDYSISKPKKKAPIEKVQKKKIIEDKFNEFD